MSALLLSTLGVVCPSCDLYNAPGITRCRACGASLGFPAAPAQASARNAPAPAAAPRPVAPPPAPAPPGMKPKTPTPAVGLGQAPIPASELVRKPAPPTVRAAQPTPSKFGLTVIAGQLRGQRFRLGGAGCMVGRAKGAILFPEDPFVSPHHATFLIREGRLYVRDESSASGVFATVAQEQLQTGSCFAAGQRLFRYTGPLVPPAPPPPPQPIVYGAPVPRTQTLYGVEEIIVGGRPGRGVVTGGPLLTIGQQHCDLSYPGDDGLALRHCELAPTGSQALLRDLSGGLGTYVRLRPGIERPVKPGDRVRIGMEIVQVEAVA